jgi:hypothetical protein
MVKQVSKWRKEAITVEIEPGRALPFVGKKGIKNSFSSLAKYGEIVWRSAALNSSYAM